MQTIRKHVYMECQKHTPKKDGVEEKGFFSLWIFSSGKGYTRPWFGMEI